MIYQVRTDFQIQHNSHVCAVTRADHRSGSLEILIPSWQALESGAIYPENAMIRLHHHELSPFLLAFADEAWRMGIKPTGMKEVDVTPQITAMALHLADMRNLVFDGKHNLKEST